MSELLNSGTVHTHGFYHIKNMREQIKKTYMESIHEEWHYILDRNLGHSPVWYHSEVEDMRGQRAYTRRPMNLDETIGALIKGYKHAMLDMKYPSLNPDMPGSITRAKINMVTITGLMMYKMNKKYCR